MRISPDLFRRDRHGYALLVVMSTMAVMLLVFASTIYWASSNANITQRNNLFTSSEAAAESCTEDILATMMRDYTYGSLNTSYSYTTNSMMFLTNGWPLYFQFSDTNGNITNIASVSIGLFSTAATNLNSQFVGLFGFVQPVTIACTATPKGVGYNLSATVYQSIEFAQIPLFQYAIFYNMDLEINPGAGMTINGRVHSNNNIWATGSGSGTSALTFSSDVDAAGTVSNLPSPLDPQNTSRAGNVVYSLAGQPVPDYTSMNLPIGGSTNNNPTNVQAILEAPPAAMAPPNYSEAYSSNGMIFLANAVDLIVSNRANGLATGLGTNLSVYYQNPNDALNPLQYVPPDFVTTNSGVVSSNYSFATNVSFYDYRESDTAQAVQIDVGLLNTWLTNTAHGGWGHTYDVDNSAGTYSKGHGIDSIYVYNSVSLSASQLPAVRIVDGARLPPGGLTVATTDPVYIKGNYNTTTNGTTFSTVLGDTVNTAPAAILADAVTILSSDWSDTDTASTPALGSRYTASTTINAAMLEGIVPSNGKYYSGGVENFLRLEENWGGITLTYNGSIVVMYPSQYATNFWQTTGNYYDAPTRSWGFDTNFENSALLPPLTPTIKATIRASYAAW